MKLINVRQGSEEWIKWRRTKICATDSSVLMNLNPWKTPLKLYEEKIFDIQEKENDFMRQGKQMESQALECFESEFDLIMLPVVVVHDELNYMAASLDGMTLDQTRIVEIKCGKKSFEQMEKGIVPPYYFSQIQHQLCVTGLESCLYYCFNGEYGLHKKIERDQNFIDTLIEKSAEFWECLKKLKPPVKS